MAKIFHAPCNDCTLFPICKYGVEIVVGEVRNPLEATVEGLLDERPMFNVTLECKLFKPKEPNVKRMMVKKDD